MVVAVALTAGLFRGWWLLGGEVLPIGSIDAVQDLVLFRGSGGFAMLLLFLLVCSIAFSVFWWCALVGCFFVGVATHVSALDWF